MDIDDWVDLGIGGGESQPTEFGQPPGYGFRQFLAALIAGLVIVGIAVSTWLLLRALDGGL